MATIHLRNLSVAFPIYNSSVRSFKKDFIRMATGGNVARDMNHRVVVNALNNITLSIVHGDRVGLIGHNGAGKSTLLRLLSGVYEPTSGDILVEGHVSPMLDLMQGMEVEFTGYENIFIRGALLGLSKSEIQRKTEAIAELTGLGDYLAMPARTYSSGMMVRLAFAISACIHPEILLIDEIFGAGDENFMQKARKKMVELLEQSSIVVMANHSDEIIRQFCNKGLVLESGQVKFFGPVDEALALYHSQLRGTQG